MNRLFEIQTLSEKRCFKDYGNLKNGGTPVDPITIITGGLAMVSQLFPNIFGGSRQAMTQAYLDNIFPGSGYWTVKLKAYLKEKTRYTVDAKYWYPFENQSGYIADFAYINRAQYAPDCSTFKDCAWGKFLNLLKQESLTGGNQPVGNFPGLPGGIGSIDWQTLLLFGGGAFLLFALMNKKKTRKRK